MHYENCPFQVTPYDSSRLVKNTPLANINYTNQDFWSMKSRLVDYIRQKFSSNFTDFVESDLAILLIENWAFIADTLSFKIDQIANEVFIDSVSEVDNAFRLAMLVGFKPLPPIAARSMWVLTITNPLSTDLVIGTPVRFDITASNEQRSIELFPSDSAGNPIFDDQIVIPAGSISNSSIIGLDGETLEQVGTGTGDVNQYIRLNQGPVIWDSVRVTINGVEWEQVDYFTDSQERQEYRVEHDTSYNAYVLFGNSRSGMVPTRGCEIRIMYRVGGGVVGNIVTGAVETQRNYLVPGFDFLIPVTFRNYTKGEYGYAGDTIDDIKRKLPPYLRSQNRAVTGDDYQSLAESFASPYHGQIGKARSVLRQYGCAANVIDLYVLGRDGEQGLQQTDNNLKNALQLELESKKMLTDFVCLKDGEIIEVDVTVDVVMDKFYRKFQLEFRERISKKINGFFSLNNWDYEQSLQAVDIVRELADLKEIKNVEATFQTDNETNSGDTVTPKFYEIIRPNTITINFVYE